MQIKKRLKIEFPYPSTQSTTQYSQISPVHPPPTQFQAWKEVRQSDGWSEATSRAIANILSFRFARIPFSRCFTHCSDLHPPIVILNRRAAARGSRRSPVYSMYLAFVPLHSPPYPCATL